MLKSFFPAKGTHYIKMLIGNHTLLYKVSNSGNHRSDGSRGSTYG